MNVIFFQQTSSDKCGCISKVVKGKTRCVKPACDRNGCNDKARCVQRLSESSQSSQSSQSCKLTMYDQTYFRGKSVDITKTVSDLRRVNFDNAVASVKIEGTCCWTLFSDKDFRGASVQLVTGEYQSSTNIVEVFKKASSAKSNC